jgi:hypothetical protein
MKEKTGIEITPVFPGKGTEWQVALDMSRYGKEYKLFGAH